MDKMKMETIDITERNVERIGELFPNCITEKMDENGNIRKAVNFDILKQMLSEDVVEGCESYEFTWVGKKAAIVEANKPIRKTLRPCPEESVNWNSTENLYIEGDNLEVLKLLQESYLGKIKLIYIDPPYNTGNDFVYRDNFSATADEYDQEAGVYNLDGYKLFRNTDTNGRFHSDWCSMLYSRLMLARNVLSDEGVLFVSIDEHEIDNCLKILDDVFGRSNRAGVIIVKSNPRGSMSIGEIANLHEYLVVYCKNACSADIVGHKLSDDMTNEYKYHDEIGDYRLLGLRMRGGFWRRSDRPNLYFPIYVNPSDGSISLNKTEDYFEEAIPVQPTTMEDGTWRWSREKVQVERHLLIGKKIKRGDSVVWDIYQKDYYDREGGRRTKAKSIWDSSEINYQNGTTEIKDLFGKGVFDYSKPVYLLTQIIEMIGMKDGDIVMDFFSGSATTAHAVIERNSELCENLKFILVQLPEATPDNSVARREGYDTICELGEQRIRLAGAKIVAEVEEANRQLKLGEEPKPVPDVGFRVLRIDSSNFTDTYATPDGYAQDQLHLFEDNVKPDRSDLDLLFQVLPTLRIPYSAAIEEIEVCGKRAFDVNHGQLVACFDVEVGADCIEQIAKMRPIYAVFRDASMADDATEANFEELFKTFSPDTVRKVI